MRLRRYAITTQGLACLFWTHWGAKREAKRSAEFAYVWWWNGYDWINLK
jgi:hypothetical protein